MSQDSFQADAAKGRSQIKMQASAVEASRYRSGAVARMLQMPVGTLRVWERRYALTQPLLTPSGQRLYSADDVRRLGLLKQLTDLGHAIGSLASLDMAQLLQVAATHSRALQAAVTPARRLDAAASMQPWRLAVIGAALGPRLQRPVLLRALGRPLVVLGPFTDAAEADRATRATGADALLVHAPQLHDGWLASLAADAPTLAKLPAAVLYGFAADAACQSLAEAGVALLREPQADVVLAQWLQALSIKSAAVTRAEPEPAHADGAVPPPRWDEAVIAEFAGRPSGVACECPRHVAELLLQLSHFEAYSAGCADRNADDAALHRRLREIASAARAGFESALEQVALHEGLVLPPPRG